MRRFMLLGSYPTHILHISEGQFAINVCDSVFHTHSQTHTHTHTCAQKNGHFIHYVRYINLNFILFSSSSSFLKLLSLWLWLPLALDHQRSIFYLVSRLSYDIHTAEHISQHFLALNLHTRTHSHCMYEEHGRWTHHI